MDCQPLISRAEVRCRAEHIGADEHAAVRPPKRDLIPGMALLDSDAGERAQRTVWDDVMPDTEPSSKGGAVAVVAVEQLHDARRCARGADTFFDTVPVDRIDYPDAAVLDECVRAALHELVGDPAEAPVELVAEAELQRCHIAAQRSKWGKSDSLAASISCSTSNGMRRNEISSSSSTIAYSLQGKNGTGSSGCFCS